MVMGVSCVRAEGLAVVLRRVRVSWGMGGGIWHCGGRGIWHCGGGGIWHFGGTVIAYVMKGYSAFIFRTNSPVL